MPYRHDHHPLLFEVAARTTTGPHRVHNEDAFRVGSGALDVAHGPPTPHGSMLSATAVFGVYDGLGTYPSGETASHIAAAIIHARLAATWPSEGCIDLAERLEEAVKTASFQIYQRAHDPLDLMAYATTATVAAAVDRHLHLAHAGDGRAYLFRDQRLSQLTRDHDLLTDLVASGLLTPAEAESFVHKNVLSRALGVTEHLQPDTATVDLSPGDVLLFCTDGLHTMLDDTALAAALHSHPSPAACAAALIESAEDLRARDNTTVIVALVRPFE